VTSALAPPVVAGGDPKEQPNEHHRDSWPDALIRGRRNLGEGPGVVGRDCLAAPSVTGEIMSTLSAPELAGVHPRLLCCGVIARREGRQPTSSAALAKTASSIDSVSRPVNVLCWDT
jgi:hypothetical protein